MANDVCDELTVDQFRGFYVGVIGADAAKKCDE
jgi:hypothetical protein